MLHNPRWGRLLTVATAASTALMLAVPALASGWDQQGADAGNTRQAAAEGPHTPGLKWHTDLADAGFTVDSSVTASGTSAANEPRIGPDGTVILRGLDSDGDEAVIGLDPADGRLSWSIDGISSCGPALDSQDRLWVLLHEDHHDELEEPALAAFDPTTGDELDGTRLEFGDAVGVPTRANWCQRNAILAGGDGDLERLVLIAQFRSDDDYLLAVDVSGEQPNVSWVLDGHEQDLEWDTILRAQGTDRTGVTSADTVFVPTVTGGDTLHVTALSLADGTLTGQGELPYYDGDGNPVRDSDELRVDAVRLLLSGDRLVAGLKVRAGGKAAAVHGLDVTDLSVAWSQVLLPQHSTAGPGPKLMAVSGDNVVYNVGHSSVGTSTLGVNDLADGTAAGWAFDHEVRDVGGSVEFELVTDAAGRIYTKSRYLDGERSVRAIGASGAELWTFTLPSLLEAAGLDEEDEPRHLHLGPIDDDGTLYLQRYDDIFAIDSSGGLSEQRYTDVDPDDHPFADAISWATFEEITTGYADGTWRPAVGTSRQGVAAFFHRLMGEPEAPITAQFSDVPTTHPFHDAIAWMDYEGITTGYEDGTFRPTAEVTRQAVAAFMHRLDGGAEVTASSDFSDVPADHPFYEPIPWMADEGISTGYVDGTFRPTTVVSRQAVGSFMFEYATE